MSQSKIEWTDATWNPVTGCTRISEGCKNCYAERMARRLQAMGQPNYQNGFAVTCHPGMLSKPLEWKKPRMVFVNSMSDLFHESVPDGFIADVFDIMSQAHWHQFQVLTKRSGRLRKMASRLPWPDHVWMGVTIENNTCRFRMSDLEEVPASVRFVSFEPLLEPLYRLDLSGIHWVIVGGESGPGARPMEAGWVRDIRDLCLDQHIPFYFKQWGGTQKKKAGRVLDGQVWDELPIAQAGEGLEVPPVPEDLLLPVRCLAQAAYLLRGVFIQLAEGKPLTEILTEREEYLLMADQVIDVWAASFGIGEDGD